MSSFNENTGLGLLKNHALEFVKYPYHTQDQHYNLATASTTRTTQPSTTPSLFDYKQENTAYTSVIQVHHATGKIDNLADSKDNITLLHIWPIVAVSAESIVN